MGEPIEIDRTLSRDEIIEQYQTHWEIQRNKAEIGYAWVQTRIQTLGYKSLAEFSRPTANSYKALKRYSGAIPSMIFLASFFL